MRSLSMRSLALALLALAPVAESRQRWREVLAHVDVDAKADESTPVNMQYFPSTSNKTDIPAQYFPEHGSKRTRITYGPFEVQPMDQENGMVDYIQVGAAMPCDSCTITFVRAGLEYPNGSYANANTSLWLHHIVLIDHSYTDTVCGSNFYGQGQRWFASGNERTKGDISRGGTIPMGYYLGETDLTIFVVELMNQAMHNQTAMPWIEYEWIPGLPQGFYNATPVWMDIGGCGGSDQPAKSNTTFSYTSPAYTADFSGAIIAEGSHLHDGGTTQEILKNGDSNCLSTAYYGENGGYFDAPGTMYTMGGDDGDGDGGSDFEENGMDQMDHISQITGCYAPTGMIKPGDQLTIKANYNFTAHMPMLNTDGSLADIMGISIIYAALNMTQDDMMKFAAVPAPVQIRPTLIDPAMEMDGDDDGPHDMMMAMTCSAADSPGNLSTIGLDMTDPQIQQDYLTAILDDACLQYWSSPYARYFWYGIATVIGLFTLKRIHRAVRLQLRLRAAASSRLRKPSEAVIAGVGVFRSASYRQFTPTSFKVPPVGTIVMVAAYLIFILCLTFIRSSTGDDQSYQSIGVRAAWVTVAQLPLVIVLAGKRNFVDLFTAVGYERLNVLHRWVARGLFLTATFHFGFQNEGWRRLGLMRLEWTTDTCPPTGVAAYAILVWMQIAQLPIFRKLSYEIWVAQHILTFFGLIIAIMLHIPETALFARIYPFIGIGFYLFSRLVQTLLYAYRNITPGRATITQMSNRMVEVRVHGARVKSWTPGSFVLLGMPRLGLFQSHPATIASTPTSDQGDLVFYLRRHRGFTQRLLADAGDTPRVALIDGPYGGKQDDLAAYTTTVLIAGSTGISFVLPILRNLTARATEQKLPVQCVRVIWAARDSTELVALQPVLDTAIASLRAHGIDATVHLHATGTHSTDPSAVAEKAASDASSSGGSEKGGAASPTTRPVAERSGSDTSGDNAVAPRLQSGRPDLPALLAAARAETEGEMGVAVCGPLEMSRDVRNVTASMRGTYLHVEGFAW